jgi:hypothetical protein
MDNILVETIIEKVDGHEKRLFQNEIILKNMEEGMSDISGLGANIKKLEEVVGQVQERMSEKIWPIEKLNELSLRLKMNNDLLLNPVKTKTKVVHTAGKLGWVILFLSCFVIFLTIGLFETVRMLHQNQMNDLLWRYVKVTNKDQNLEYLQAIEKHYLKNPESMKAFIEQEELNQTQQSVSKALTTLESDSLLPHNKPNENRKLKKNSILKK